MWAGPSAIVGALLIGALAAVSVPAALGALVLAGAGVAAYLLKSPALILHLLVLSVFIESLGVGPLRIGRVLAIGAIVAIAARLVLSPWRPPTIPARAWLPVALLMMWAWASGFWASSMGGWSFAMGQLGLAAAYFAAFALFVDSPVQVRLLLRTFVIGALVATVVGVSQWAAGARAVGYQGDANLYALYQVASIPAAVALARTASSAQRRWWLLALAPLALSVLASESRGGLLATLVVIGYIVIRGDASSTAGKGRRGLVIVLGLASLVVLAIAGTTLNARLDPEKISNDRASGRLDIWHVAWRTFQDDPLTGIGGGNFVGQSVRLLEREPGVELLKSHLLDGEGIEVHNVYLETLVEYGLPGFGFYTLVIATSARGLHVGTRRFGRSTALVALLPMLVAFVVGATFLSVVNSKLLWMLVGMGAAFQSMPFDRHAPAAITRKTT